MKKNIYFLAEKGPCHKVPSRDISANQNTSLTLLILLWFSPVERMTMSYVTVSKHWCNIFNSKTYWNMALNQLYLADSILNKVQPERKCDAKSIYKVQVKIIQEYSRINDTCVDQLKFERYKCIFGFESVIKAVALNKISFIQAIDLTYSQIELLKTKNYKISKVVKLQDYRVQSLLNGLNPRTALHPKFSKHEYDRIRWDWASPTQLTNLKIEDFKQNPTANVSYMLK